MAKFVVEHQCQGWFKARTTIEAEDKAEAEIKAEGLDVNSIDWDCDDVDMDTVEIVDIFLKEPRQPKFKTEAQS